MSAALLRDFHEEEENAEEEGVSKDDGREEVGDILENGELAEEMKKQEFEGERDERVRALWNLVRT